MQDLSIFMNDLKEIGVTLTDQQINQLIKYYEMLIEKNNYVNLTAITEFQDVFKKHFIDSMSISKILSGLTEKNTLIDVGTGAGFPGLVLKIAFPDIQVTLMDSLNKRIAFLNEVITALSLTGITAVHGRAEDMAHKAEYREKFDICVSRAVANLNVLAEYDIPFVKVGGFFISYKAGESDSEIDGAENAVKKLGGQVEGVIKFCLPGTDMKRVIVKIKKTESTDKKYPRKAGTPERKPLK